MTNLSVPLVPTSVPKPTSLNDMKYNAPLIKWCEPVLKDHGKAKTFNNGSNREWKHTDSLQINQDRMNVFAGSMSTPSDTCVLQVNAGSEHHYIAYVEFDMGRHFTKPFTWMGVEWYQDDDRNNSCFIRQFGREYKYPSNGYTSTHSTGFWGEGNKETKGYFHYINAMSDSEIDVQKDGYLLSRVYFGLRSTSGVGSAHQSRCNVFNLRLGWGEGEPSTNHMIVLPKIRPFEEQTTPAYGEES